MAFKSIHNNNTSVNTEDLPPLLDPVFAKELGKGESVEGYFVGVSKKDNKFGGINYNALMENGNGERFIIYSVGSLKYDLMDERLEKGLKTRITSRGQEERESKDGKNYTIMAYTVEQDPDDSIDLGDTASNSEKKTSQRDAVSADVVAAVGAKKGKGSSSKGKRA